MADEKELVIREMEGLSPLLLQEVLDFVRFLKATRGIGNRPVERNGA